jgi:hypothetical protein
MKYEYPQRLSVQELRQELDAYLEYRRTGGKDRPVDEQTVNADRSHIGQFLGWLETGRAGRTDIERLAEEFEP